MYTHVVKAKRIHNSSYSECLDFFFLITHDYIIVNYHTSHSFIVNLYFIGIIFYRIRYFLCPLYNLWLFLQYILQSCTDTNTRSISES
jgi:hypothetical protein